MYIQKTFNLLNGVNKLNNCCSLFINTIVSFEYLENLELNNI